LYRTQIAIKVPAGTEIAAGSMANNAVKVPIAIVTMEIRVFTMSTIKAKKSKTGWKNPNIAYLPKIFRPITITIETVNNTANQEGRIFQTPKKKG